MTNDSVARAAFAAHVIEAARAKAFSPAIALGEHVLVSRPAPAGAFAGLSARL
ncbi:MAG TPA: hypothetical protein VEK55_16575 [Xanthobacteraceae bacterium]|nr:hypothetical protein [Xanthobacteraceae bacterium]